MSTLVWFYSHEKRNAILFLGVGFMGTGLLDGYHAVVTSAYFKALMPSDLPSLILWSWMVSCQFLSVMLLMRDRTPPTWRSARAVLIERL